jgi:2-polyprenyl-3-methyl-5-hydroxy-6-metoxy-1,4-benzoquinol methylase
MTGTGRSRTLRNTLRTLASQRFAARAPQHNMHEDPGEAYYLDQYLTVLAPLLGRPRRVLDVGCQFGRFALPLAAQGHDVVGTDIDADCLAYIAARSPRVDLRLESAEETAGRPPGSDFDLILCLELLYVLPAWETILAGLAHQLGPTGRLAASHRSQGYYIHRLLREHRYDELDQVLAGRHPALNAQSPDELRAAYAAADLEVESITPIGSFSGIAVDPFAAVNDPSRLAAADRQRLQRYESDPAVTAGFMTSARYLLVVATPRERRL